MEHWNAFANGFVAGSPLMVLGAALAVGLVSYLLVRLMMRVRWLRIVMRIGYFAGVAGLVGLAAYSLSYYQLEAWLPLGGSVLMDLAGTPLVWPLGAVVVAAGLALKKPVPPRHGIRVASEPPVEKARPAEAEPQSEAEPDAAPVGPWRQAA